MKNLYPKRIVKSIYFDTRDLTFFHESNEGILPRKKVRIRSYNDEKTFYQEIKYTSEEGRYKLNKKILKSNNSIKINDKKYGVLIPTLEINYNREYFIYKNLRLTFDNNIKYKNLKSTINNQLLENLCVMEIKTDMKTPDEFISSLFSLRIERFSKYSRGIDSFINH
tara:strand:+ start:3696 stop:4196 length:501 start_codon:yes stop_codon:yes gene_type:complete